MKWIALVVTLIAMPPFIGWLRRNPHQQYKVWTFIGIFPFVFQALPRLQMALYSWPLWPGLATGIEISIVDLILLSLYLSYRPRLYRLPFRFAMAFYLFAILLSIFPAESSIAVIFYAWQLVRIYFAYVVISRFSTDDRVSSAIFSGMAIGLCIEAVIVIWQRFGQGVVQTTGTFGHQNLLGMLTHFVVLPTFALLLAGRRGWQPAAVLFCGLIVNVLGASRATLGLMGIGLVSLFFLSAIRSWTPLKAKIAVIGVIVIAIAVPLAMSSLSERFSAAPPSANYDERAAFIEAASMMLSDHPMGVGANNFTVVNNLYGYADRAGLMVSGESRLARVHNIYWLMLAETGYLGLFALLILLLHPMISAFVCGWRNRKDQRGDILLGIGVTFLIVYIHSYFEFVFLDTKVLYFYAYLLGFLSGLGQQLGYWNSNPRHALGSRSSSNLSRKKLE